MPFLNNDPRRPFWISNEELEYRTRKNEEIIMAKKLTDEETQTRKEFLAKQKEYLREQRMQERELKAWNEEFESCISYAAGMMEISIFEASELWQADKLDLTDYGLAPMPETTYKEELEPHYPKLSYEDFYKLASA